MRACILSLLVLAACDGSTTGPAPSNFDGPPAPDPRGAFVIQPTAYCTAVAMAGVVRIDRDLVTTCPPSSASDGEPTPPCIVQTVRDGTATTIDVGPARIALRGDGDKIVVLRPTGQLVLLDGSNETQIAAWAADPSVAPDLVRVAYVTTLTGAPPPDEPTGDPGTMTRVVVTDTRDASEILITEDSDASSPRCVPGSTDVIYVSTRTSLASVWRGNGEYEVQVTNVDLLAGDQGIVPAYGARAVWIPDTRRLVYEAAAEDSRIWQLDLLDGTAIEVGPGAWPAIGPDGTLLGAASMASDPACATAYPTNPMP